MKWPTFCGRSLDSPVRAVTSAAGIRLAPHWIRPAAQLTFVAVLSIGVFGRASSLLEDALQIIGSSMAANL